MSEPSYGSLPFDEAIQHFRNKLNVDTKSWNDISRTAHVRAFMVAGAKDDVLLDLRAAVDKAISEGTTIAAFRKDFDGIIKKSGWAYNGDRNWRTRVIYDTNLRQAHHAGRWSQIQQSKKRRPFLEYRHGGSVDPRPQHQAWDGLVLSADDPFWDTHYPQNGWGCKCRVRSLSQHDLDRRELSVSKSPPASQVKRTVTKDGIKQQIEVPKGIDPGFDYNVGKAWYRPFTLSEDARRILQLASNPPTLPIPKPTIIQPSQLLDKGLTNEQYANHFLQKFGDKIGQPVAFKDKAGGNILISEHLFKRPNGTWKIQKNGREKYLLLFAEAIKNPDEIWIALQPVGKRYALRRRYLMRLAPDNRTGFAVFEWDKDSWAGNVTVYDDTSTSFGALGLGTLAYKKEQ